MTNRMIKISELFENSLLFLILIATIFATAEEVMNFFVTRTIGLADLLLLFLYVEVVGMIASYYRSHVVPIQLSMFIAITALARLIVLQGKDMDPTMLLFEAVAIFVIACAIGVLRYTGANWNED